ncbi:MAG: hypothetical protein DWQ01_09380 [Planctomycetota bacterium]|nr:MAG: hypothetical protein DWQ01_09380 [Planctomycetota bacterium]
MLALLPSDLSSQQSFQISNNEQRCTILLDQVTDSGGTLWQAIRLLEVEDLLHPSGSASISLGESPIWRLDFRELQALGNPSVSTTWKLVPSLDPAQNPIPDTLNSSSIVWAEDGVSAVYVNPIGNQEIRLIWQDLPLNRWYPLMQGTVNVRVVLKFPNSTGGLEGSIDVEVFRDGSGNLSAALLSVNFPDLLIAELDHDEEPDAGAGYRDDVLLSGYQHGTLWFDPIHLGLADHGSGSWGPDNFLFDFGHQRSLQFTYPGETSCQFLYYYDFAEAEDADEPFIYQSGNQITGYGKRPSTRGKGQGLYLAAHDPDLNTKRIVTEVQPGENLDQRLHLAVRTFLEFTPDRMAELQGPATGNPRWQAYYQGPDSLATTPNPTSGTEVHFTWPIKLSTFKGDWLDAALIYREFFVAESKALYRDSQMQSLRLRDLPSEVLPPAFLDLVATIGVSEVVSPTLPYPYHMAGSFQALNLRAYLNFLRENYQNYQDASQPDPPYYAVIHGEGMISPANPGIRPFKSGGTDDGNFAPRDGFRQFYDLLRNPDPAVSWPGFVLTALNRDHGSIDHDNVLNETWRIRRENSVEATRNALQTLSSYMRFESVQNLVGLLDQSFALFHEPAGHPPEVQLDWYWTSGQGSAVKPDYSRWFPAWQTGNHPQGVGGGDAWFTFHRNMRQTILDQSAFTTTDLSPHINLSTERLNEAVLQYNVPAGHRQPYPCTALEQGGLPALHPLVYAENLNLTSHLYHDFALMRTEPESFSLFYGVPRDDAKFPLSGLPYPVYFDQTLLTQRAKGTLLSLRRLAQYIYCDGLLAGLGVESSGRLAFEIDINGSGTLDHYDDRLSTTFSKKATVGEQDAAAGGWLPADPATHARSIFRARSRMRQFFNGGRRVRDPKLIQPAGETHWYANNLSIIRWNRVDLNPNSVTEFNGGLNAPGGSHGLSLENVLVGTYVDDDPNLTGGAGDFRILLVAFNASPNHAVQYQMQFSPADWNLPSPGTETYKLRGVRADLSSLTGAMTGAGELSGIATNATQLNLPEYVAGQPPILQPFETHLWVFEIE